MIIVPNFFNMIFHEENELNQSFVILFTFIVTYHILLLAHHTRNDHDNITLYTIIFTCKIVTNKSSTNHTRT